MKKKKSNVKVGTDLATAFENAKAGDVITMTMLTGGKVGWVINHKEQKGIDG